MKLYFSKGACSLVVRIVIHELNLKCDFVSVDLKTKKLESGDDYLKINPKGAVPALETDKGLLTENQVIQQYLCDTNQNQTLLPKIPEFSRYRVLELLNFITTDIHKGFGPLFSKDFPADVKKDVVTPILVKKFEFINKSLEGKDKFIMGNEFTLPDAYLFVVMRWAHKMHVELSHCKNLKPYYDRLLERKSIQQSLQEEGLDA